MWLGGLFIPEAYITATRQYVAQANNWSLEELKLAVNVVEKGQKSSLDDKSFAVTGTSAVFILVTCKPQVMKAK